MKSFKVDSIGFLLLALSLSVGCAGKHDKPNRLYSLDLPFNETNADMFYSPALKAQEPGVRTPPQGTVPTHFQHVSNQVEIEKAGEKYLNPLPKTPVTLARGKHMYQTYCLPCHGEYGEGNGTVVPKFPMPPSLQSEKILNYKDGNIFWVITHGQNLMPSYRYQIIEEDRWAIVNYVRAIQRAKNPKPSDLQAKR